MNQEGIERFRDAKLGLFLHWGLYSVRSRGEWSIYRDDVPKEDYAKYMRMFNPKRFDARAWVRMAKDAGMKYICITTKHHDGFCMFDSQYTDWKITNTAFGRDVIRELADACHEMGMLFGLYYSIWDLWHDQLDAKDHLTGDQGEFIPDAVTQWKPGEDGIRYMHNQVEELCTKYGKVDYFFFDVRRSTGESYDGVELIEKMRKWQPDMIINDRLGIPADVKSPENFIPDEPLIDEEGNLVLWESCMVSNKNWGYVHSDKSYKSSDDLICEMVNVVSKGGNFLTNVGPTALGEFPVENQRILKDVGHWLDYHGEAIYGCEMYPLGDSKNHFRWRGVCATVNKEETVIYLHITNYPSTAGVDCKIELQLSRHDYEDIDFMTLMEDGSEVIFSKGGYYGKNPDVITIELPNVFGHSAVTTVAIHLK